MIPLSCTWVISLLVIFTFFIVRAYLEDQDRELRQFMERKQCSTCAEISKHDTTTHEGFHAAVVATIRHEHTIGESKLRKIINSTRDQVIRGAIMGAIGGSAAEALHSAVTWSLVGGIVSGMGDLLQWKK